MSIQGAPFQPEVDSRINSVETAATTLTTRVDGLGNGTFEVSDSDNTETSTTNGSALSVTKLVSLLVTTAAGTRTLAAPSVDGQLKIIRMATDGGDATLAMTNMWATLGTGSIITFNDVADSAVLVSVGSKWLVLGTPGCTVA